MDSQRNSVVTVMKPTRRRTIFEQNKFFATTTLAGFGYIHRSNSRLEVVLWYIIIIFFSYITVKNVVALSDQYFAHRTVTRVSIGRLNKTYDLKVFKLRVRIGLPELNPEFHKFDTYLYNGLDFSDGSLYPYPLAAEVDEALSYLDTREKFFGTTWNYTLLPLISRYGFFISSCEFFNEYCNPEFHQQLEFHTMTSRYMLSVRREILKILNHTRRIGVSDHELLEELGRQILLWIKFDRSPDIFTPWKGRSLGVLPSYEVDGNVLFLFELRPTEEVLVGLGYPRGVCLRASVGKFVDYIHQTGILGPNATKDEVLDWYGNYKPEMAIQFGLDNRRHLVSTLSEISYWSVEVTASFHSITDCLTENSKHNCTHNCTSSLIAKKCNCNTVLIENINVDTNGLDWCSHRQYYNCLTNVTENIFGNCSNSCTSDCDIDFIDVRLADRGPLIEDGLEICLNILHKEVPVFQEHYSQTWQNFLAELGGAIDFWLGASVVSLIHLAIYILKQICYAFQRGTKTGQQMRKLTRRLTVQDPSELLEIFQATTTLAGVGSPAASEETAMRQRASTSASGRRSRRQSRSSVVIRNRYCSVDETELPNSVEHLRRKGAVDIEYASELAEQLYELRRSHRQLQNDMQELAKETKRKNKATSAIEKRLSYSAGALGRDVDSDDEQVISV